MSDPVAEGFHPLATEPLPFFVTLPANTVVLLVVMFVFMVAAVVGIGIFHFMLDPLPEQMAHRGQKVQFEIVAVLGLLSLFTHNHLFWTAGLLLAFVPLPGFSTPLTLMAQSLGKMAGGSARTQAEGDSAPTGTAGVPLDEEITPSGTAQVPLDDRRPTSSHGS